MYINKLHLRAFGKFSSKRIYFGSKFNIIYGENEAGKSTIHNFIEAILYGFGEDENGILKYNKYKPWDNSLYRGTLGMSMRNGEKYVVSKDFLLGTTQVFKKESSDRSDPEMVEEDIPSPGDFFFNMNRTSFRNTVSVRQLGNKTEQELANELKNKIINLSSTRDQNISIERILSTLNSIKEEAGSEDNGKTLLGQYSLRLSELKGARENSVNAGRQVMFLAMEKKKLKNKISELDMRMAELKKQLSDYELSVAKDKFLKCEPVKKELDEINKSLKEFDHSLKYSKEDYKEALNLEKTLENMVSQRDSLVKEKEKMHSRLEELSQDISNFMDDSFSIEKLNEDYSNYKSTIAKIIDMKSKIHTGYESIKSIDIDEINKFAEYYDSVVEINKKIEIANVFLDENDYETMKKFGKSQGIQSFFAAVFGIAFLGAGAYSGYLGYTMNVFEYYYGAGAVVPAFMLFVLSSRKSARAKSAKKEIESMECSHTDYKLTVDQLQNQKNEIIKNSGCDNFDGMSDVYKKKCTEKNIVEEKLNLLKFDEEDLKQTEEENDILSRTLQETLKKFTFDEISQENIKGINEAYLRKNQVREETSNLKMSSEQNMQLLSKVEKELSFEQRRLEMILSANGAIDIESFKETAAKYDQYEELVKRKEYLDNILASIIGNEDFNALKEKTKNVMFYETKALDEQKCQMDIFKMNEEKSKIVENIDNIHKEIEDIESGRRNQAEIEEEIDFYEDKINTFKNKIKIAEMASEKITKIADSIKGDFMPLLKKSISDNFYYLTGGKYSEVSFDENMNITVIEEDNKNRNIELESLSGGTLDQLYLSLRVGLSNILSGNQEIPLIFDDSFVQYDSRRLKKSIEMLARESERRQVILFTCQEREAETAKQLNVKFNYIKL
jgi:uncharacterized protein YhaN